MICEAWIKDELARTGNGKYKFVEDMLSQEKFYHACNFLRQYSRLYLLILSIICHVIVVTKSRLDLIISRVEWGHCSHHNLF
jgi:hypothetical protein